LVEIFVNQTPRKAFDWGMTGSFFGYPPITI
jgi:hypothetical protein